MASKPLRMLSACLALGAAALQALGQSSFYVVTVTDMQKNNTFEVMSREQVSALKASIQAETRLFPAALAAARKEWEASDRTKDKPFQTTGLAARKMREEGPFSQEMAQKKADKKTERGIDREYDKNFDKSKGSKSKLSEKDVRRQEREAERAQLAEDAAALVQKHLEALAKGSK